MPGSNISPIAGLSRDCLCARAHRGLRMWRWSRPTLTCAANQEPPTASSMSLSSRMWVTFRSRRDLL